MLSAHTQKKHTKISGLIGLAISDTLVKTHIRAHTHTHTHTHKHTHHCICMHNLRVYPTQWFPGVYSYSDVQREQHGVMCNMSLQRSTAPRSHSSGLLS